MESRPNPGPALLQHHDRLLGVLMADGFSAALATHAFSAIDAYVYGFADEFDYESPVTHELRCDAPSIPA